MHLSPRIGIWLTLKFFVEIAQGRSFFTFKALHVVMTLASLLLAVRLMRVRTAIDFAAATIALYIIVGMHTFLGLIEESFPINNHLTPVLGALIAANLAYSRGGWSVDIAAITTFVVAALTVETGLVIPVVLAAAYLLGWRGVSLPALTTIAVLLLAFGLARVVQFGDPGTLIHTGTGFGLSHYEPSELSSKFAGELHLFFIYNALTAIICVLFSEPQGGTWEFTKSLLEGDLRSWQVAEVASSALLLVVITIYLIGRRKCMAEGLNHADRLVLLAFPVLIGNAAMSFAYSKNVILGTAGIFWALAGYAAIREMMRFSVSPNTRLLNALMACALVFLISLGFSMRTLSSHLRLIYRAASSQSAWAEFPRPPYSAVKLQYEVPKTAEEQAITEQLRSEALSMPVPPEAFMPEWLLRLRSR